MEPMLMIWIWIILGAVGGFLHWIIPTKEDKPNDITELVKRIFAGAVAVPVVMLSVSSFTGSFEQLTAMINQLGYVGYVLLGYFSIDIWKMFRDFGEEMLEKETPSQ